MEERANVLILDDDPSHLKLYGWVVKRGGFTPLLGLIGSTSVDFPDAPVDVIALDYRLKSSLTPIDVAKQARERYPESPIIILSDLEWMPRDIAPYAVAFVNKGEPQQLLDCIATLMHRKIPADGA